MPGLHKEDAVSALRQVTGWAKLAHLDLYAEGDKRGPDFDYVSVSKTPHRLRGQASTEGMGRVVVSECPPGYVAVVMPEHETWVRVDREMLAKMGDTSTRPVTVRFTMLPTGEVQMIFTDAAALRGADDNRGTAGATRTARAVSR